MPVLTLALTDIPEGVPHKPDGADAILIRRGREVTALAHLCPHLGLPLAKGVVRGDTLICAFHHACFDARSGRQMQPPGHADLSARDIVQVAGRVAALEDGQVVLEDGGRHAFDALLLAPGGVANIPDLPGIDLTGVHTLRSAKDAAALSEAAASARRAVLIGGGFIGMEGALSLAKRGVDVTVLLREDVPLAKVLGERIGRAIRAEHEDAGVTFVTGADAARLEGGGAVERVVLEDGASLEADLVVLAIGVHPATADIDGIETAKDGGVATGPDLSVPGRPGVFVAGDCAQAPTPFGSARIEHWRVARQHGIRAARAMLGREPAAPDIPYFWTALGRQYRYLGHAEEWDDILVDGDPSGPFLARYVSDGRVMAAVTAGRDADLAAMHLQMVEAGGPIPA